MFPDSGTTSANVSQKIKLPASHSQLLASGPSQLKYGTGKVQGSCQLHKEICIDTEV